MGTLDQPLQRSLQRSLQRNNVHIWRVPPKTHQLGQLFDRLIPFPLRSSFLSCSLLGRLLEQDSPICNVDHLSSLLRSSCMPIVNCA